MQILRDDQVPAPPEVDSYQETVWSNTISFAFMASTAVGLTYVLFSTESWTNFWVVVPCLLGVLLSGSIARLAFCAFFASRNPANWLVRWSPAGLYVRYRSYLNGRFPKDTPTVLFFAHKDVAWIRPYSKLLTSRDSDGGDQKQRIKGLEIGLKQVDATALTTALRKENLRRDQKRFRFNHTPVILHPNGTLRVEVHRPAKLLDALAKIFPIAEYVTEASKNFDKMSDGEKDTHILELVQAGETVAAIKVAREVYACSLTEAKQRVDNLVGR